jgi:hypothetical protein
MVHGPKLLTSVFFILVASLHVAKAVEVSDLGEADLILQHITASINYLWSTTINDEVWMCEEPCNGTWEPVDGYLKQLDASDTEVWGIDSRNAVYKAPIDGSANWTGVPGSMKHISASGNGFIWAVDSGSSVIHKCKKPCMGEWEAVPLDDNGRQLTRQLDGEYGLVYAVTSSGKVYSRPVDGSGRWRKIPGPGQEMVHVTASGRDMITGIAKGGDIYQCMKPCVGEWEKMEGTAQQCDASVNEVYCIKSYESVQ